MISETQADVVSSGGRRVSGCGKRVSGRAPDMGYRCEVRGA
jgi:hypothetical protein